MTPPRRLALAAATLTLAALTTACGAVGQAVDCNNAAKEATAIVNEWTGSLTASATDPEALGKASKTAAQKTKDLAGKYDGEVAAALNDLSAAFSTMEGGDMTKATELTTKVTGFQTKLQSACT